MQRSSRSVLVTTVALVAASIVLAPTAQANPATSPDALSPAAVGSDVHQVISGDFPDPGFLRSSNGRYYLYATGQGFRVSSSTSPSSGFSTPQNSMTTVPDWVTDAPSNGKHLWAPHVFEVAKDGAPYYVMYFTGHDRTTHNDCIGLATSKSPAGPFAPRTTPFLCARTNAYEAIDPTMYLAQNGQRYIVYKIGQYSPNRLFEIRADEVDGATGTTRVAGVDAKLLMSSTGSVMEAPSVVAKNGKVWMFLSRNAYDSCSYATDVWSASTFWGGTWTQVRTLKFVKPGGAAFCGPGGAEVIDDHGTVRIAFHAWNNSTASGGRSTWTGRVLWNADNWPYIAN